MINGVDINNYPTVRQVVPDVDVSVLPPNVGVAEASSREHEPAKAIGLTANEPVIEKAEEIYEKDSLNQGNYRRTGVACFRKHWCVVAGLALSACSMVRLLQHLPRSHSMDRSVVDIAGGCASDRLVAVRRFRHRRR